MTKLHIVVFFDVFCTACGFDIRKTGDYDCECDEPSFFNWIQKPATLDQCYYLRNCLLIGENAEFGYIRTSDGPYRSNAFRLND